MRRFSLAILTSLAFAGLMHLGAAQQPPTPSPQMPPVPAVQPAPAPAPAKPFPTGAKSSRHHWLAHQATWDARFMHVATAAPAQFTPAVILTTGQMSYWGNDQYGDCVSAEEAFAKDIYPVYYNAAGKPVKIPTATVVAWARQHGWLNGADLTSPMDAMATEGMTVNGVTYTDGPYKSVDYTNWSVLTSAIYEGPVKIGVAAAQLQNTPGVGSQNGWVATGYRQDGRENHCTSLCGYGTMQYLCSAMGVAVPSGVDPQSKALLFYTWDTIGIMDFPSMVNITSEAWLRSPTTPQTPPGPAPTPTPTPTPGSFTYTLGPGAPSGARIDSTGLFSWPIPATQTPGTITITFTAAAGKDSATGSFVINVAAAGAIVVAPIPAQSGAAGSTFSLNLNQYVSQPAGLHGPGFMPAPAPAHP